MKPLCRIAFSVCASLFLAVFVSSCALGLDPAKSSSGTTVSLHLSSLASAVSGRAIIQGSGYLYIQTGSTAADAKLYGPWQTGSGELFSTSEVPSGSYDYFTIVNLDSPALTSPVFVDETNTTILSALQSRLYDRPDTLLSCSCALLSGISIRSNRDNPLEATLVPATTKAIDISGPSYLSVPDASSGTARSFVMLNFIDVMKSGQLVDSLSIVKDGSGSVSRMALYALNGKLISAANKDSGGTWTLSYPSSGDSSCYLYLEYQGAIESSMVDKNYVDPSRGVWYVNQTGGSDGSDAAHPCMFEQAIQCINKSTYEGTQTIFLTGTITLPLICSCPFQKNAAITSAGATPYAITYNGAPSASNPLFYVGDSTYSADVAISNCTIEVGQPASYLGHLIEITKGNLVLSAGATLRNNPSATTGGAVQFSASGTFTMTGGTISNCSAGSSTGGAVYMSGGTFKMTGGTITGCSAKYNGGAVGMSGGTFAMSGGTINCCSTTDPSGWGGGVYISSSSTANFSGGAIEACSSNYGGAIGLYGGTANFSANLTAASLKCTGNMGSSGKILNKSAGTTVQVNGVASTGLSDFTGKTGYAAGDLVWN